MSFDAESIYQGINAIKNEDDKMENEYNLKQNKHNLDYQNTRETQN